MMNLPIELYQVKQIREMEKTALKVLALSEEELMVRAGEAAFDVMLEEFPDVESIAVFCGRGNNAGDGFVLANLAHENEIDVQVFFLGKADDLPAIAKRQLVKCRAAGIAVKPFSAIDDLDVDVIVDALVGIGIRGPVDKQLELAINAINGSGIEVLSIDVPSGIDPDTGAVMGAAIKADVTVTFVALKQGFFTGAARHHCGALVLEDLGLEEEFFENFEESAHRLDFQLMQNFLFERHRDSHKNDFGHVLVIGGDFGMAGAVRLAAEAALRVGAGVVTVATRAEHVSAIIASRPELMCLGVNSAEDLKPLLDRASVIVLGPGLGDSSWSHTLFKAAMKTDLPMVIDAQALPMLLSSNAKGGDWVLTPHPGEAAQLLKKEVSDIAQNRFAAALQLHKKFGGTIVLKGAGTILQSEGDLPNVCSAGNPGMASPGVGDVLAGVIAGLIAQGYPGFIAAAVGVSAHSLAGDVCAQMSGERGLLASDLFAPLQHLMNPEIFDDADEGSPNLDFLDDLDASANDDVSH